jgi:hypothetical protein
MGLDASPTAPAAPEEPENAAAPPTDEERVAHVQRGIQSRTLEYSPAQRREWASLSNIAHQLAHDENYSDEERAELQQQIDDRRRAIFLNPNPRLAEERPTQLADELPESTLDVEFGPGVTAKIQRVTDANGNASWQGLRNAPNPLLIQQAIASTALELLRLSDTDANGTARPRFKSPDEALAAARALYGATPPNPQATRPDLDPTANPADWIQANPNAAAEIASTQIPSRTQWNKAGLPKGTPADARQAFAQQLRNALHVQ